MARSLTSHTKARARALTQDVFDRFQAAGALPVEADVLLPSETLLDLYGETIRGRAYVTDDPVLGELMLRPDFTVPVVQLHMAGGAEPARYTYMGEVYRRQSAGSGRSNAFLQAGYELFDREDPARADAEVFATLFEILQPYDVRAVLGDIGILTAAVNGLTTSPERRAALLRHIWRPRRFKGLLERFGGNAKAVAHREALVAEVQSKGVEAVVATAGEALGLRSRAEIIARLERLVADAGVPDLPAAELDALQTLLGLRGAAPEVLETLRDISVDLAALAPALDRLERRLDALGKRGLDVAHMPFEASFGRTSLEYYDGFVFGISARGHADWPPLASGGRYDALTRVLGQGREIPAVGGVIRPELLALLEEQS